MLEYSIDLDLPTRYLLDFWSPSCVPCKQILKILPKWSDDTHVLIVKVDVEAFPALAEIYQVRKVPTFVYIVDGKEYGRFTGVPRLIELTSLVGEMG